MDLKLTCAKLLNLSIVGTTTLIHCFKYAQICHALLKNIIKLNKLYTKMTSLVSVEKVYLNIE